MDEQYDDARCDDVGSAGQQVCSAEQQNLDEQNLVPVDEDAVRQVLKNWHNSTLIGQGPLAQLRIVQHQRLQSGYGETNEGNALALRDVLHCTLDEVKALARPDDLTDDQWVYVVILTEQFINRRKSGAVQDELALGRRAFFNKQKQALSVVAQKLAEREAQHTSAQDVAAPPEAVSPPDVGDFVGRSQELTYFQQKLEELNYAVIVGFPGAGKTLLAAKLVRETSSLERVFWYQCRAGDSVESLLWALASFLVSCGEEKLWRILYKSSDQMGQDEMPLNMRIDYAMRLLAKQDYLICLDDFQMIADDEDIVRFATQLHELTQTNPLQLVITSRAMPPFIRLKFEPLAGLRPDDIKLLIASQTPDLRPEQATDLHTELYNATDGLPLFLNLALGILRETGDVDALLERLPQEESVEQYLLQSIDQQLSHDERLVMGGIAVLDDYGGDRAAIEVTIGGGSIRRPLSELRMRNLLTVRLGPNGRKYSQHAIVRTFYYEELGLRERQAMHRRAATYYLEHEQSVMQAALQLEHASDHYDSLHLIAEHIWTLINQGHGEKISNLLDRITSSSNLDLSDPQISFLWSKVKGAVHRFQGKYREAIATFERTLQKEPSSEGEVELLKQLGATYERIGEFDQALKYYLQSLDISKNSDNIAQFISTNFGVGWVNLQLGKIAQAQVHFDQCLENAEQQNDRLHIALATFGLGIIDYRNGRLQEARERLVNSRDIFKQLGDFAREAQLTGNLSMIYTQMGDTDKAIENSHYFVEISEQTGNIYDQLSGYNNLGYIYSLIKDHQNASYYYTKLVDLAQETEHMRMLSLGYSGLADAALIACNPEKALELGQGARDIAQAHNYTAEMGVSYRVLGNTWLALNDFDKAKKVFTQSIPLLEEAGETEELQQAQQGYQQASLQQ